MKFQPRTSITYHNNRVFHPNGKLMFFTARKKINFYLKNNLANIISENPDGTIDIKLTFEPQGFGCTSEYDLSFKNNVCVVSGESENLTQHHIVPAMYTKFFPDDKKNHNGHDLVLITIENHLKYEREAHIFRNELAIKYGTPTITQWMYGENRIQFKNELKQAGLANAIYYHSEKIPPEVLKKKITEFIDLTGLTPTEDNLKKIMKLRDIRKVNEKYGKLFVPFISNIEEFRLSWRKHFIDTMNPQFMPKGWSVNGNIKLK